MSDGYQFFLGVLGLDKEASQPNSGSSAVAQHGAWASRTTGRPPMRSICRSSFERETTCAATFGSSLYVTTVAINRSGRPRLVAGKTGIFRMEGRDQDSVQRMFHAVRRFLSRSQITALTLREAAGSGPVRAQPAVYKVEALLQMMSDLDVDTIASARIAAWVSRNDPELVDAAQQLSANDKRGQTFALQTAAFKQSGGLTNEALLRKGGFHG